MITHLLFLLFVAIAVYAQSVTGFALSFILLGLIGTINLVPIIDAVNIVSVILVINSITFLYKRWPAFIQKCNGIYNQYDRDNIDCIDYRNKINCAN